MSYLSCRNSRLHALWETYAQGRLIQQWKGSLSFLCASLSRSGTMRRMRNHDDPAVLHALRRNYREDMRYMP